MRTSSVLIDLIPPKSKIDAVNRSVYLHVTSLENTKSLLLCKGRSLKIYIVRSTKLLFSWVCIMFFSFIFFFLSTLLPIEVLEEKRFHVLNQSLSDDGTRLRFRSWALSIGGKRQSCSVRVRVDQGGTAKNQSLPVAPKGRLVYWIR